MKTLPLKLRKNGFNYTQVLRGKRSSYKEEVSSRTACYEVFLIKVRPEHNLNNKTLTEIERFPHNEAFGLWAWAYGTKEHAINKFNQIDQDKNFQK